MLLAWRGDRLLLLLLQLLLLLLLLLLLDVCISTCRPSNGRPQIAHVGRPERLAKQT